jgi:hypothetical protein
MKLRFAIVALAGLALSVSSASAQADTAVFKYTGLEQGFAVPEGVTSLHVVAVGGKGGTGENSGGGVGGFGAVATADLPVTPAS